MTDTDTSALERWRSMWVKEARHAQFDADGTPFDDADRLLSQMADRIEALEARDKQIREKALREVLAKEDSCGFVSREDILSLIKKEQTDD